MHTTCKTYLNFYFIPGIFPRYLRRLHWGTLGCFLLVLLFIKPPNGFLLSSSKENKEWMLLQKQHQPTTTSTTTEQTSKESTRKKEVCVYIQTFMHVFKSQYVTFCHLKFTSLSPFNIEYRISFNTVPLLNRTPPFENPNTTPFKNSNEKYIKN